MLSQLKELNIKISIDDFGTGYSSLNYLKRLMTVAEGVEDQTQLNFLLAHGCQVFQGYLFSKPQIAKEIEQLYFKQ